MSSSTWEGLEKWLSGYAISLIMTPIPIVYNEPVSYNYNGTKLPPFSHYDKNFYPYICLYKDETCKSTYVAYATTLPFIIG
jgi:hypothetical protein